MKKSILFFAAAALFAACSQDNETPEIALENSAIGFSAYTSTPVTRGTVNTTDEFYKSGSAFGVFAFYQPAVNEAAGSDYTTLKYPTPDFMYNQKIEWNEKSSSEDTYIWKYSPVKYWPNNTNDKLSFFAYAPYDASTTWEDMNISTDVAGTTVTKTFDIYNDVAEQKDYLFANPILNKVKPKNTTISTVSTLGTGTTASDRSTDNLQFAFSHVTSKVNLYVGVNTDVNTASTGSQKSDGTSSAAAAWTNDKTEIEIKSIEFKDLATTCICTYNVSGGTNTVASSGEQDITVVPSATDFANKIDHINWATGRWHRVLSGAAEGTAATDQYMFIAPQTLKDQEIVITYVVKTTDTKLKLNGGKSEITNVITKKWSDFKNEAFTKFEAGMQYRLYFLIGMQSVKVAATITDWTDATAPESVIDVPAGNK